MRFNLLTIMINILVISSTANLISDPVNFREPDYVNTLTVIDKMTVSWEVYNKNQTVIFQITSNSTGWIGFGFNHNGLIVPADLCMGGLDQNGLSYFTDRFAKEVGKPIIDKVQDWHLIQALEKDGKTTLRFHRLWDTKDFHEDLVITDKKVLFLWALGVDDNVVIPAYHGLQNRGTIPIQILRSGTLAEPMNNLSSKFFEILPWMMLCQLFAVGFIYYY